KALRSFLRADPDVVMVGEIRDNETAQTAIEASLTGHLVLSTLHTNSAPETVTRLLDMGMDPFNFADSLLGVLAQRLVRKLCAHCRTNRLATDSEEAELVSDWMHAFGGSPQMPDPQDVLADWRTRHGRDGRLQVHHAKGCERCDNSGYKGRLGLHELMVVDRPLRALIQTHARAEDLQRCALGAGMRTLRQDGIEKVLAGLTTIEEVRATSNPAPRARLAARGIRDPQRAGAAPACARCRARWAASSSRLRRVPRWRDRPCRAHARSRGWRRARPRHPEAPPRSRG